MKRSLKDAAKKGEKESCKILAKEIVRARKAVNRLYASKAHMNSVQMQMKNQLGRLKNGNVHEHKGFLVSQERIRYNCIINCDICVLSLDIQLLLCGII